MKSLLVGLALALSGLALCVAPADADAKRLGGGRPAGMQRQAPPQQPATPPPNAAPQNGAAPVAGAAAAAGKRSWMGPLAGLAAGLGIAALLSHFGLGEGLANLMTMLLFAALALFVIRWLLRRFAPASAAGRYAAAGGAPAPRAMDAPPESLQRNLAGGTAPPVVRSAGALPPGFDAEGFERTAKQIFVRLQAANDAGEIDDLRKFTTPELFASLRVDLQERGGLAQQTDVLQLDAKLVDSAQEDGQWVVSVRFSGVIRERADAGGEAFAELWHLVKPADGRRDWAIAGITPLA